MRLSLLLASFVLAACSADTSAYRNPNPVNPEFFLVADGTPASDRLVNDCVDNSNFDACIFQKNPVAQEGSAIDLQRINEIRRFGVKIRGLKSGAGTLESSRVSVRTLHTPRLSVLETSRFKAPWSESRSDLEQVSAYYWATLTFAYLEARVGAERVPQGQLHLFVDDAFTGFSSKGNSIHFERKSGSLPKAFSGEVVVHLIGQALASRLSDRRVHRFESVKHKLCGTDPRGCCTSDIGCAQSLQNAFGDYVAAMIFPMSPKLGETLANSPSGQSLCANARDLSLLASRTRAQIYNACGGNAVLMGAWYASLWWRARTQADSAADIDQLFFEHAKSWNESFTFAEAKAETLRLAASFKGAKYANLFTQIFQNAGI